MTGKKKKKIFPENSPLLIHPRVSGHFAGEWTAAIDAKKIFRGSEWTVAMML